MSSSNFSSMPKNYTGYPTFNNDVYKVQIRYIACQNYVAGSSQELSFEVGDIIIITENDKPDWWTGRLISTQQKGLVPSNHW